MGNKLLNTTSYETVVQLLALAVAILAPFMAFNFMDLELFSVSKSMFTTLWSSSINPWLCPPYVYILINFIIVFIAALSFIHSNTIIYDHSTNDHDQTLNAPFIDSSLISQTLDQVHEPLVDDDFKCHDLEFHKFEDTFKNQDDYLKPHKSKSMSKERHNKLGDMLKLDGDEDNRHPKVKKLEEVVHEDKRELRKSRTFHEGGSSWSRGRKERYVRILSQQELDQRVEAFINKFKKT
ncbi:general transcriptional corepressor trfA-like protein [Tanacetum coccineum]